MKSLNFLKTIAAAVFVVGASISAAHASTVSGQLCGNKYIGLTQNGTELTATMCQTGNSTGATSPITPAGWTDSAEYQGSTDATVNSGPVTMVIDRSNNTWSLSNPAGYAMLGISIKQGNGFAFYVLDVTDLLSGMWFTGNGPNPTGNSISHINAWYKGDPTTVIPLPAAGWLLLAGLGGLAALRRRRKS